MRKVINFVKGKREEKRVGGADVVNVRNLSPEGLMDEDTLGYDIDLASRDKTLSKLHKAAWSGNLEKLKGSMKKTDLDLADKQGRTPLHLAAVQGHSSIVWFLISNRAKLNLRDHEGKTPLLKAIECRQQECAQLLLERGADVNISDNYGNNGLHVAAAQGCNEVAASLLRKGAKLESPNRSRECALHLATRGAHRDMAEFLLRYGSEVNLGDADERTPLMLAARAGIHTLVSLYLEYGADCSAMDSNGWTAEDYAVLGGHNAVAMELQARNQDLHGGEGTFQERAVDVPEDMQQEIVPAVPPRNESVGLSRIEEDKPTPREDAREQESSSEDEGPRRTDTEGDSPRSLPDMPPPLKPPRSWDLIQAGLTIPEGGSIPRQLSLFPRAGSWDKRSTSMAGSPWDSPASSPVDAAPLFYSLNRRAAPRDKKPRPTSLPVTLPETVGLFPLKSKPPAEPEQESEVADKLDSALAESRDSVNSDWDSEDSLPLDILHTDIKSDLPDLTMHTPRPEAGDHQENGGQKPKPTMEKRGRFILCRTQSIDLPDEELVASLGEKESATLGREGTMQGREEVWHGNATISPIHSSESSSSEDFFFQSSHSRGAVLKHQATVVKAHIETNSLRPEVHTKLPLVIPETTEGDYSADENPGDLNSTEENREDSNSADEIHEDSNSPDEKPEEGWNEKPEKESVVQNTENVNEVLTESSPEIEQNMIDMPKVEIPEIPEIVSSPEANENPISNLIKQLSEVKITPEETADKLPSLEPHEINEAQDVESSQNKEVQSNSHEPGDHSKSILQEYFDDKEVPTDLGKEDEEEEEVIVEAGESLAELQKDSAMEEALEEALRDITRNEAEGNKENKENILPDELNRSEDVCPTIPPRKKRFPAQQRRSSLTRISPEGGGNIKVARSFSVGHSPNRPDRKMRRAKDGSPAHSETPKMRRNLESLSPGNPEAVMVLRKLNKKIQEGSIMDIQEVELSDRDSIGTHSDDTSLCYAKSPHAVLKRRLRAVTADRARLEHIVAGLEEQVRRLQYELADALHAARTQREISTQLARQLSRAQKGQHLALEEHQVTKLQLSTNTTELELLRSLYEDRKAVSPLTEKEDARAEWEHQHQLEQLRAEKSKLAMEKSRVETQAAEEMAKLKDDVLKWMKLYESSTRNSSGVVCERIQEKTTLESVVSSVKADLEMSLRRQAALEKELGTLRSRSKSTKEASTFTNPSPNPENLARELTCEKERSRRGVQTIRKLRAEVQSLRSRVLAAERRSQSASLSNNNNNYLPSRQEGEAVTAMRRQLEELGYSVEEERAQRASLERTILELRTSANNASTEQSVETTGGATAEKGCEGVTRAELDKVRRSYEVALARARQEAELSAREELSLKLAQVNTFLEEQLQQQSRLEQLRCTSESQLRQDFQQTRHKLLNELAKVQATLRARSDEDRRIRKKLSPTLKSEQLKDTLEEHVPKLASSRAEPTCSTSPHPPPTPLRPAAAVLSMLVPAPSGTSVGAYKHLMRQELERNIRRAAEAADVDQPILEPENEQLTMLKKKYLLS